MSIVREQLDFSNALAVLLKMGYQFSGADFPNSNVALHTPRANKFTTVGQANSSHASLVGVVDLPKQLAVVDAVSSDTSVRPTAQDNLIGEYRTQGLNTANMGALRNRRSDAASSHRIVVTVPQPDRAVLRARYKFIAYVFHKPNGDDGLGVILTKQHLTKIIGPNSVNETSVRGCQHLQTIGAGTQSVHCTEELSLQQELWHVVNNTEQDDLAVAAADSYFLGSNSTNGLNSFCAGINVEG